MVRYTKFRDDRPIRSRVILGKPEGMCVSTAPSTVPARVKGGLFPLTINIPILGDPRTTRSQGTWSLLMMQIFNLHLYLRLNLQWIGGYFRRFCFVTLNNLEPVQS